jgi:hypothetical protein
VSFSGPFTPGSDTFSSAALPGNPELKGKRCRQACSSCSRKKTRCNGSKRHCYYTSDREAQRINQRRIENLKHLVADQDEHISELEAQIAILRQQPQDPQVSSVLYSSPSDNERNKATSSPSTQQANNSGLNPLSSSALSPPLLSGMFHLALEKIITEQLRASLSIRLAIVFCYSGPEF